eukprot:10967523-Karenia_brevis.AAC.1
MNVHQQSWLRHSSAGNTVEGRALQSATADMHLKQIVKLPTRGANLLDLCLTNAPGAHSHVLPKIVDHGIVSVELPVTVSETVTVERE